MAYKETLSWTQLNTIEPYTERSLNEYFRFYIKYPRDVRPTNAGMEYGKKLSEALEVDGLSGDPMLDLAIAQIPRLEIVEHEIQVDFKTNQGIVPILAQLDWCSKDMSAFKENKTHNEEYPWTQKKADESGQITFYATAIWLVKHKIPKDIELVGIPTRKLPDGQIEAKGEVYTIKTNRTEQDIMKMLGRMQKAWFKKQEMKEQYAKGIL